MELERALYLKNSLKECDRAARRLNIYYHELSLLSQNVFEMLGLLFYSLEYGTLMYHSFIPRQHEKIEVKITSLATTSTIVNVCKK